MQQGAERANIAGRRVRLGVGAVLFGLISTGCGGGPESQSRSVQSTAAQSSSGAPASPRPTATDGGAVAPQTDVTIIGKTPPEKVGVYQRAPGRIGDDVPITYRDHKTLEGVTLTAFADRAAGDTDIGPELDDTFVAGDFLCGWFRHQGERAEVCYTTAKDGTLLTVTPAENAITMRGLGRFANELLDGLK